MHKSRIGIHWVILLAVLAAMAHPLTLHAQDDPDQFIAKLVEQMSPQAKVGQLFVVSFPGANVRENSDVATLILKYNVGGVVISPYSNNIVNAGNTPARVAALTASLQNLAISASQAVNPDTGKTAPFIPLFIAMPYNYSRPLDSSGVLSYSQAISGMTPLPSSLALGAAWKSEDAQAIGNLLGQELAAMGINVTLGPSLDVLTTPSTRPDPSAWQVFGGDPYWVGKLGHAFAGGVQEGGANRVMVAMSHFPGQGKTSTYEGTIDRSLDELKKLDMLPFLQVMSTPAVGEGRPVVEALVVTQMRYRGFGGNIRERTRPLAVDAQAMQLLLEIPEVKNWHDTGGVLFSDSLGSLALRQYYSSQAVAPSRAAQDAFLAGNDVLVLSDFGGNDWNAQFNAITTTITFFQDRYSNDLAFQRRVNEAIARILRAKYHLYPGFDPATVPADLDAVNQIVGHGYEHTARVAQNAITQLWPLPPRPGERLSPPLDPQSTIVILTDDMRLRDCPTCESRQALGADALARAITQRYGTSGRIDPTRITNLSFGEVRAYLDGTPREGAPDVGAALDAANRIVIAILDPQSQSAAALIQKLVVERPSILDGKNIVAFSFRTPSALNRDALDRLAAYYCVYDSSAPFLDIVAQMLLGDLPASGSSPISIPSIGYDLTRQTEPDPRQIIQILVGEAPASPQATPQPLEVKVGDTLKLRTGVIVDRNGHSVPDGTPVTFTRVFSDGPESTIQTVGTRNGAATVDVVLDKIGSLRIRAFSEPALTSSVLQVTSSQDKPVVLATIVPPTATPLPPTPTTAPTPLPTLTPTPTATPVPPWWQPLTKPDAPRRVGFGEWFAALLGIAAVSAAGYRLMIHAGQTNQQAAAMRWALWCGGGGVAGYILYGLGAPGLDVLDGLGSLWASLIASVICAALPLGVALWRERARRAA